MSSNLYSLISKENYENCVLIICIQYFGSINEMNLINMYAHIFEPFLTLEWAVGGGGAP